MRHVPAESPCVAQVSLPSPKHPASGCGDTKQEASATAFSPGSATFPLPFLSAIHMIQYRLNVVSLKVPCIIGGAGASLGKAKSRNWESRNKDRRPLTIDYLQRGGRCGTRPSKNGNPGWKFGLFCLKQNSPKSHPLNSQN